MESKDHEYKEMEDFRSKESEAYSEPAVLEPTVSQHRSLLYKILKTLSIVLIWFCIGLWSEINGPTLPDLIYRTGSNYEIISSAISMRGAGNLAGSVLGGGYIVDKFHSKVELILAVCLVCCAGLNAAIPYSPNVEVLYVVSSIEGWMEALVNIAGQVTIMDIWREKASGPLHLIHLGFGAGGFIAPQIVAPFISDKLPKVDTGRPDVSSCDKGTSEGLNQTLANSTGNNTAAPTDVNSNFQYGFLIVSGVILVISAIWFFYAWYDRNSERVKREKTPTTFKEIFNFNTCLPGYPWYAFGLYLLLFVWIYIAVSGERIFAKYLYAYARELCFEKQDAANLLTAFWVSFTAGRFSGFVVANFLHMKYIIFIEGIGNLASALVLYFWGHNYYVLWVCVCISGLLIGPCYPSGLSWANRYMKITATGVTVLSIGGGVSDLSFVATVGYFIERDGISVMTTFVLAFGAAVCILPIIMQCVAHQRGDRFENEDKEDDSDNNNENKQETNAH